MSLTRKQKESVIDFLSREQIIKRLEFINKQVADPGVAAHLVRESWSAAGKLIAYPVGRGKTLVGLTILTIWQEWLKLHLQEYHPDMRKALCGPMLIVSEGSGRHVWSNELKKWYRPLADADWLFTAKTSSEFATAANLLRSGYCRAVSVSYTGLAQNWHAFSDLTFSVAIFDECHNLSHPESAKSKAIHSLMAGGSGGIPGICIRIGLSGTPLINRVQMFWGVLATLNGYAYTVTSRRTGITKPVLTSPEWAYNTREKFERLYLRKTSRGLVGKNLVHGSECSGHTEENCGCLHPRIKRVSMLDRMTPEEARLPGVPSPEPEWVEVPLAPTQRALYNGLMNGVSIPVDGTDSNNVTINRIAAYTYGLGLLQSTRQLAWSIANKTDGGSLAGIDGKAITKHESPKLDWLCDFVENQVDNESILVFTAFAHQARYIAEDPRLAHMKPILLSGEGGMSAQDAEHMFQTDATRRLLVATAKGFKALTLTKASIVIMFGFVSWNPLDLVQAIGRVTRYGQNAERILVYLLYAPGTLEDWLRKKLRGKLLDASAVIDGRTDGVDDLGISTMSQQQFLNTWKGEA